MNTFKKKKNLRVSAFEYYYFQLVLYEYLTGTQSLFNRMQYR